MTAALVLAGLALAAAVVGFVARRRPTVESLAADARREVSVSWSPQAWPEPTTAPDPWGNDPDRTTRRDTYL